MGGLTVKYCYNYRLLLGTALQMIHCTYTDGACDQPHRNRVTMQSLHVIVVPASLLGRHGSDMMYL